jgi:hypothetical protein
VNPTKESVDKYIRNGWVANDGQFPYQAYMEVFYPGNAIPYKCGGALISTIHVLTSASCLWSNYWVDLWFGSFYQPNSPYYRRASGTTIHPSFFSTFGFNIKESESQPPPLPFNRHDVGIVLLHADVPLRPAKLPRRYSTSLSYHGVSLTVSGFGDTDDASFWLRYTYMTGDSTCNSQNVIKYDELLCGNGYGGSSLGEVGDNGAPLVDSDERVVGVANCCSHLFAPINLFTRVDRYLDWISGQTGIAIQN